MKQCGDDWKAAKANNTTNGMKWPEFLKQCRAQKEAAAPPPPAAPLPPGRAPLRLRSRRRPPDLSAEAEAHAGRAPDGRWPIRFRGGSEGPLPRRHGRLGQH